MEVYINFGKYRIGIFKQVTEPQAEWAYAIFQEYRSPKGQKVRLLADSRDSIFPAPFWRMTTAMLAGVRHLNDLRRYP